MAIIFHFFFSSHKAPDHISFSLVLSEWVWRWGHKGSTTLYLSEPLWSTLWGRPSIPAHAAWIIANSIVGRQTNLKPCITLGIVIEQRTSTNWSSGWWKTNAQCFSKTVAFWWSLQQSQVPLTLPWRWGSVRPPGRKAWLLYPAITLWSSATCVKGLAEHLPATGLEQGYLGYCGVLGYRSEHLKVGSQNHQVIRFKEKTIISHSGFSENINQYWVWEGSKYWHAANSPLLRTTGWLGFTVCVCVCGVNMCTVYLFCYNHFFSFLLLLTQSSCQMGAGSENVPPGPLGYSEEEGSASWWGLSSLRARMWLPHSLESLLLSTYSTVSWVSQGTSSGVVVISQPLSGPVQRDTCPDHTIVCISLWWPCMLQPAESCAQEQPTGYPLCFLPCEVSDSG